MKTICFYFQVHQPWRLKRYRFFDMGRDHNSLDALTNRSIMQKIARECYLPMNALLFNLIRQSEGRFRCTFSLTGLAVEQMRAYAPEVLDSFRRLARTGCVEFLAETYSHSLASLSSKEDFMQQVALHTELMKKEFAVAPTAFRNTELIYSDEIGEMVARMGYKTMLTEGARHILGWKSPDYVYTNSINPKLKLLLKNFRLSDDIAFRFSDKGWDQWPLTADKYASWLNAADGEIVNLFMDYETLGEHQGGDTGIFDFIAALPAQIFASTNFEFLTPKEAAAKHQPVAPLHVPYPISWADEERDVTAWLGNELQNEAFEELYKMKNKVNALKDPVLTHDFDCLQASDHFYYMCTKLFSDGAIHQYFTPYDTPYEAFINYMNVLSDFIRRVEEETDRKKTRHPKEEKEPKETRKVIEVPETSKEETPKTGSEKKKARTTTKKK